jgi:hypothetical protein
LVSCIKAEELNQAEKAVDSTSVFQAVGEAWGPVDPETIKKNDFLYEETTFKVENQSFIAQQEGVTVLDSTDFLADNDPKKPARKLTFAVQRVTYKNQYDTGSASTVQDERSFLLASPSEQATANSAKLQAYENVVKTSLFPLEGLKARSDIKPFSEGLELGYERMYMLAQSCFKPDQLNEYCQKELGADSCDIQCTNLKTSEEIRPAPKAMQTLEDCGGLPNCQMRVKAIAFNWIFILKKGNTEERQKVNYNVAISPDLPFFARLVENCARGLGSVPGSTQKFLVTSCTQLGKFKPGSN